MMTAAAFGSFVCDPRPADRGYASLYVTTDLVDDPRRRLSSRLGCDCCWRLRPLESPKARPRGCSHQVVIRLGFKPAFHGCQGEAAMVVSPLSSRPRSISEHYRARDSTNYATSTRAETLDHKCASSLYRKLALKGSTPDPIRHCGGGLQCRPPRES
jgi:hypothetical protein